MGIAPPYVELHCHSAYSFLDGVSLPDELAARAHELGYEALALTDHNSVSGSMELALSAEQYGLRAIHGAEIDLTTASGRGAPDPDCGEPGRHITLLVENDSGWRNLCRIITLAHAGTRDGARRRDRAEPAVELEAVLEHADGLVCLTGCALRSVLRAGVREEATGRRLLEAFGPDNLRVELQSLPAWRPRAQPHARGPRPPPGGALGDHRRRPCPRARQG